MIDVGKDAWLHLAGQINLAIALRSYPVGIPSLMASSLPVETPFGIPIMLEISPLGFALFIIVILIGLGLILGTLYYQLVAQVTMSGEIRWGKIFHELPRTSLQVILLALIWVGLFLLVSIPASCLVSVAALAGFSIVPRHVLGGEGHLPPSEKVNLACIGVGNRGWTVIRQMEAHNIVAICDVDENYLEKASERYPNARKYNDFRQLIDGEEDSIDAVTVCSPDHTHAPASMAALTAGKHVYCEKPLTHSVYEARTMAKAARETGLATQMGHLTTIRVDVGNQPTAPRNVPFDDSKQATDPDPGGPLLRPRATGHQA